MANLPESIQQQVLRLLSANNFPAAKAIYDAWLNRQREAA